MDLTTLESEYPIKADKFPIDSYIQEKLPLINRRLLELVPESSSLYRILFDAARYSLDSNAKRLRPILLLATLEDYQISSHLGLDTACSIEFIHTYSLIHDDLPCMDNDDLRRGKPSLHKAYDEATAFLAGDFLLTYAFEVIANTQEVEAPSLLRLTQILAKQAGGHGMIAGQVLDLAFEGQKINEEKLLQMHSKKTAGLFIAALEMASVIAKAPVEETKILSSFGTKIGLSFQIMDDVLDITSPSEILGKPSGSDLVKEKATAVELFGLDGAKEEARRLYQSALHDLDKLDREFPRLRALCSKLFQRSF